MGNEYVNKPLVSVIIPVFNSEEYIERCILSIENQTYENIEIIVCDDCSSDGSYEKLIEIKNRFNNIILLKNDVNMKSAYTRNKCIMKSRGEYIAIQDIDDYSDKNRIKYQVEILENEKNIHYVSTGMVKIDGEIIGEKFCKDKTYPSNSDFLWGLPYIHGSSLFKKEALYSVDLYTVSKRMTRTEDFELFIKLHSKGLYGKNIKNALYFCNEDINNYNRRKYRYRIDEFFMRLNGYKDLKL